MLPVLRSHRKRFEPSPDSSLTFSSRTDARQPNFVDLWANPDAFTGPVASTGKWGGMESHVERLIASCGLAQFSYRTWPATEIMAPAAPAEPSPPTEVAHLLVVATPAPVAIGVNEAAVMEADVTMAGPSEPVAAKARAAAEAPAAARARTLLASLYSLIEKPPSHPAGSVAPGLQRANRPRGPLALPPPEGFEAPIHVGYHSPAKRVRDRRETAVGAIRPPAGGAPAPIAEAGPARRFALLDELLPVPPRHADRRAPPSSTP